MTDIHTENDRSSQSESPQDKPDQVAKPEGFKTTGSRLPDVEQTEVTHYAYDPQTYEVICRPGQRLTQKKAQRLQALELYAHVVRLLNNTTP